MNDTPAEHAVSTDHGRGWLHGTPPPVSLGYPDDTDAYSEWHWVQHQPARQQETNTARPRVPRSRWVGWTAGLGAVGVLVMAGTLALTTNSASTSTMLPTSTAAPPTSASTHRQACDGLNGQVVTAEAGDPHTLAGVVAEFEHAYYVRRDPTAALHVVAPESELTPEALAAGIDSIPQGTTHCVAITPIAEGAAEVHLVEKRPQGGRVDYLQMINTHRDAGHRVRITNIQVRD